MVRTNQIEWTIIENTNEEDWASVASPEADEMHDGINASKWWLLCIVVSLMLGVLYWTSAKAPSHGPMSVLPKGYQVKDRQIAEPLRSDASAATATDMTSMETRLSGIISAGTTSIIMPGQHYAFVGINDEAASVIALNISRVYTEMVQRLGLALDSNSSPLSLEFSHQPSATNLRILDKRIFVSSAHLTALAAPTEDPDLPTPLINLLARHTLTELQREFPDNSQWQFVMIGLRKWLESASTRDISGQIGSSQVAEISAKLGELPTLSRLYFSESDWVTVPKEAERILAAQALLQFVQHRFGKEQVAALLAALPESNSWENIIPQAFETSPEEFETEWHTYLKNLD